MEFDMEKCALLVMKSGKRYMTDVIELPSHNRIRTLEENETYKYLGILEADTIKQVQMKDTIRKEYIRRTRKLLETKLSSRNLIKGINTWAVPLVRYSGPFFKWTREELKQMDQRTRIRMTMCCIHIYAHIINMLIYTSTYICWIHTDAMITDAVINDARRTSLTTYLPLTLL